MTVDVSPETKQRLDQRLATGRYRSPDELLRVALDALADQERDAERAELVAELERSLEDERAGRTLSLQEFDAEFRAQYPSLRNQ